MSSLHNPGIGPSIHPNGVSSTPTKQIDLAQNPYASESKWRHVESTAFARWERENPRPEIGGISPSSHAAAGVRSSGNGPQEYKIICGPLLNFRRMEGHGRRWFGSVLIVTEGGGMIVPEKGQRPVLKLRRVGNSEKNVQFIEGLCLYSDPKVTFWRYDLEVAVRSEGSTWEYGFNCGKGPKVSMGEQVPDPKKKGNLPGEKRELREGYRFVIPAFEESMRIMFFSCNGFSVGTDENAWTGPVLWNDVLRQHKERPFHVMIGGGDQLYNDGIRVDGPLAEWADIANPKKRKDHPFPEELRQKCDEYYLRNYLWWYSTEPFASANCVIPQLNIWDDHDIIDGFGSYVDRFMKCDVFRGIGGTAHKYYMLFQHHLPPPARTYTTGGPSAAGNDQAGGAGQTANSYVHPPIKEPNYIYGPHPGPYVAEHTHNMFARLGARVAFVGIDARTERTRHQVNRPDTYEAIFTRLYEEFSSAKQAKRPYKHLILLLGIPIAYPRLTWLENIFSSPLMGPMKLLNRRVGFGGSFFNTFDGSVDLLDDLDDHYTARTHKEERNWLIKKLQVLSARFSVRVTILGGDVHLAALGRFYANPKLGIPVEKDYRYMVNMISSAITNKPPPLAVANLLASRNKIHHLDHETDETLLKLFDKDPGPATKTAGYNCVTMPSRNFTIITENSPHNTTIVEASTNSTATNGNGNGNGNGALPELQPPNPLNPDASSLPPGSIHSHSHSYRPRLGSFLSSRSHNRPASVDNPSSAASTQTGNSRSKSKSGLFPRSKPDPRNPLYEGELSCGTKHRAADPRLHGRAANDGSLDVCICVEIDRGDATGKTQGYGMTIPVLEYEGEVPEDVGYLVERRASIIDGDKGR